MNYSLKHFEVNYFELVLKCSTHSCWFYGIISLIQIQTSACEKPNYEAAYLYVYWTPHRPCL